jgi:Adenomatosis polyposis coli down-regulated 1
MFKASIVALVMIVMMAPHLATQSTRAPAVVGLWESETCVVQDRDGNRTGSKSTFVFLGREWALEFVQFADDRCTRPIMKAFLTGQYQITEPSSVVPSAHNAIFGFSQTAVTVYDQSLIAEANRVCSGRVWKRGEPQDVTATGCLWVTPVSACPQEFDLVKVDGNRLFLGERPQPGQNLCSEERRARTLRSLALVRR